MDEENNIPKKRLLEFGEIGEEEGCTAKKQRTTYANNTAPVERDSSYQSSQCRACEKHFYDINVLPQPLLLNILSYVPMVDLLRRVSRVCRYWQILASDPHLWRKLRLSGQLKLTDTILERIAELSQNTLSMDLTDCKLISTGGLSRVMSCLPSLQTVKLVRYVNYSFVVI